MVDITLESVRAAVLLGIVVFLWNVGRNKFDRTQNGWNLIVGGFGLLLFGSLMDISDNFKGLNFLVVVGDTKVEAFLEKFIGFLGGFVLVAVGLMRWIPSVQYLNSEISQRIQAENALRVAHDTLEHRVKVRTVELEHEIAERKLAEQEAANKSHLLEATFQNMNQGIAVFDAGHTLVTFNPQYSEIMGMPSDYLHTGMKRAEILRYRARERHDHEAGLDAMVEERLARARHPEKAERTLPNGRSYAFELTPTPDGGYIVTVTDITERREADKQLQQAQKMEAVGQLTGGIAHDFNNLLAVSMGNIELAEEVARENGDVQPFLAAIMRASERGAALTNQLLAFSRKQTLLPQVIDAGELIGGMTGLLRSSLGETIEIKVTGDDGLWPCEVDPHQLESAVLNLALNARDAMPSGGTLTIQTTNVSLDDDYAAAQAEAAPGDYILVAVTDTGTGMPREVIDHAFDPFYTTKEVGQGSGLGLSMVYGFVKQSGGHVTIYSEEGKGTTVKLYLPRSDKAEEHSRQEGWEDVPEAQGETVLVVEDDPEVCTLAVALLSSFGYEILEAADGKTALKVLETAPRVNLMFTDVVLPGGMSGPELVAEVRNRFPGMAVLYTSGYTDLANVDQSAFDEDTKLLQKPYRKSDLARKVRLVLDQARS